MKTETSKPITFALYFAQDDGKWFLHSWGIERSNIPAQVRAMWDHLKCYGIKVEQTPKQLDTLNAP